MNPSHLTPSVAKLLTAPAVERIRYIQSSRKPIQYPLAQKLIEQLDELLVLPARSRTPNVGVFGETGNGKTVLTDYFTNCHPPYAVDEEDYLRVPVLKIEAPGNMDLNMFYNKILGGLKVVYRSSMALSDKHELVEERLRQVQLKMLLIDEFHHITAQKNDMQRKLLCELKYLSNKLAISLVVIGTEDAFAALEVDKQLASRFDPFWLPVWQDNTEFRHLLAGFEASLPLEQPSGLSSDSLATVLHARSEGIIGEMVILIERAAVLAIRTGEERITRAILNTIEHQTPTQRRKAPPAI